MISGNFLASVTGMIVILFIRKRKETSEEEVALLR